MVQIPEWCTFTVGRNNVIMITVIIAITITNVVMITIIITITIMVTFKNIYIYIHIMN